MEFNRLYDIIVIGGGHAGAEAGLAASRMGADTLLCTISVNNIGMMPCNPAIGGIGKGNLVKDMDALGGEMGKNIDATGIQFRVLNKKKGPAVWCSRAQADKYLYKDRMSQVIMDSPNLEVKQVIVSNILVSNNEVKGVETTCGQTFYSKKIIVTSGTFIKGQIYIGNNVISAGRMYEPASDGLSISLKNLGFTPMRFKTDTPARLHIDSLNLDGLEIYKSDDEIIPFSAETKEITLPQIYCYGTKTNSETHKIIDKAANDSMFYNGSIESRGPRYCPSMEDKVLKFPEKDGHKLVIEPEGLNTKEVHVNGFSCSIPVEAQIAAYRTVKGLEKCEFIRPAYAIQYDAYQPTGLYNTYETKLIKGLYFAGQVNGTSGYEEAAIQGFMAAVNAVLSLENKDPFVLGRNESYIGVLTDDLITKGVSEPYRMFTSRSEYRLLTREDNAEERLIGYGYKFGLISKTRYDRFLLEKEQIEKELYRFNKTIIKKTSNVDDYLAKLGVSINQSIKAEELLRRPEITYNDVVGLIGSGLNKKLSNQVEIKIKYSGYIKNFEENNLKNDLEKIIIPKDINLDNIPSLRLEYTEKLKQIKPNNLGQALRIPGFTKSAIDALYIEIYKYHKEKGTEIEYE